MMEKMQVLTDIQEASRAESQKLQEANQKLFEASRVVILKLQGAILSKI